MSAETPAVSGQFTRRRLQFRAWRGTRPFWAGLLVLLGGLPIAYFPYAHLHLGHLTLAMSTTAGAGSLIIGVLLVVLGISLWFQKHVRVFAGVAAILLALVSIPVSNLGGFFVGFLLALIGGALAVSWVPGDESSGSDGKATAAGQAGGDEYTAGGERAASPGNFDGTGSTGTAGTNWFAENSGSAGTAGATEAEASDPSTHYLFGARNDLSGTNPANGANGRNSAG